MPDDSNIPPAQPAETATNSRALVAPESTDSAPPPALPTPPTPPKTYTSAPYTPPAPVLVRPNSAIPNFLRLLAFVLFVAGSTSAAVAWLYKTVLYPRLELALAARTKLYASHLTSYSTLLDRIRTLPASPGFRLIAPDKPDGVEEEAEPKTEKTSEETDVKSDKESAPKSEKELEATGDPPTTPSPPPPPAVFEPLISSLRQLSKVPAPPPAPLFFDPTASLPASQSLAKTLTKLTDYLTSESYTGYMPSFTSYGAGLGGSGSTSNQFTVAVTSLKTEIRQVKGTLLNRRNFAALSPRAGSPITSGAT